MSFECNPYLKVFGFGFKYGLLYNNYAVKDARNIAAAGWHVPTLNDYYTLQLYLDPTGNGNINIAGNKMKEIGTTYWDSPNTGADNVSGFNGKGAGSRSYLTGSSSGLNRMLVFWASDDIAPLWGYIAYLDYNSPTFYTSDLLSRKTNGNSVRIIKDSTSLTNGQIGSYTGNDGKVYKTICIGTQEWISYNLAETKYRNGDYIPEVTSNSSWIALTSGAMCAYNNDWTNIYI